jgi:hypothetical protein
VPEAVISAKPSCTAAEVERKADKMARTQANTQSILFVFLFLFGFDGFLGEQDG